MHNGTVTSYIHATNKVKLQILVFMKMICMDIDILCSCSKGKRCHINLYYMHKLVDFKIGTYLTPASLKLS